MRDSSRIIRPAGRPLAGEITVPGDKSISHRAVMFGAIARGATRIRNFLMGADCLSTIDCFRRLGVEIDVEAAEGQVTVQMCIRDSNSRYLQEAPAQYPE